MSLSELILLLALGIVGVQFWRLRAIAEQARNYLKAYCDKHQLQLLSVARDKTRLSVYRGKLDWHCKFVFEFSGNGEEKQQGKVTMAGLRILQTDLPAYKIN